MSLGVASGLTIEAGRASFMLAGAARKQFVADVGTAGKSRERSRRTGTGDESHDR